VVRPLRPGVRRRLRAPPLPFAPPELVPPEVADEPPVEAGAPPVEESAGLSDEQATTNRVNTNGGRIRRCIEALVAPRRAHGSIRIVWMLYIARHGIFPSRLPLEALTRWTAAAFTVSLEIDPAIDSPRATDAVSRLP